MDWSHELGNNAMAICSRNPTHSMTRWTTLPMNGAAAHTSYLTKTSKLNKKIYHGNTD